MQRLAQLLGQTTACRDVWLGADSIADLEKVDRAHPLDETIEVGARRRRHERIELVADRAPERAAIRMLGDLVLLDEALD